MTSPTLSLDEAAAMLRQHPHTVEAWAREGVVPVDSEVWGRMGVVG